MGKMKNILIAVMEEIADECASEGYYPDEDELYQMAIARIKARSLRKYQVYQSL